ncbi:unnamed protein product [Victoria cruziana]
MQIAGLFVVDSSVREKQKRTGCSRRTLGRLIQRVSPFHGVLACAEYCAGHGGIFCFLVIGGNTRSSVFDQNNLG